MASSRSHWCLCHLHTACDTGDPETIQHCFFDCGPAFAAWTFGVSILYQAAQIDHQHPLHTRLSWQQCILGAPLPAHLRAVNDMWALIRGSIIWCIWLRRNAAVFANNHWPPEVLENRMWEAILDLARAAWTQIQWTRSESTGHSSSTAEEIHNQLATQQCVLDQAEWCNPMAVCEACLSCVWVIWLAFAWASWLKLWHSLANMLPLSLFCF